MHSPQAREPLLFLPHRIPYPPNKGDKVRAYHLLRHLAARYRVFLGSFVDYPGDWAHAQTLRAWCEELQLLPLAPRRGKLAALRGLVSGEALTLPYYRASAMQRWVDAQIARHDIRRAVVFSSSMAQYLEAHRGLRAVIDFCDVDSAKWTAYAGQRRWPLSWLYRREGERLAAFERSVADWAAASVLVSPAEAKLFGKVAPAARARIHAIGNGVDADYFSPAHTLESPYPPGVQVLVFTGAMDYWPNIDAVCSFAAEVWPQLAAAHPGLCFYVVGMNPAPAVTALAQRADIVVTGSVPDVRPYLRHAAAVVAPLRVARGVQNKVLEAMAMARPVVASATCALGLSARPGRELLLAQGPQDYVSALSALLADPAAAATLGERARARVLADYSWGAHLAQLDPLIEGRA